MEAIYHSLDDPSYNIFINSIDSKDLLAEPLMKESYHWTCQITPRFPADVGGIEVATGLGVVSGLPADHAKVLREAVQERLALREGGGWGEHLGFCRPCESARSDSTRRSRD
mmetsp:Transcript_81474/g.134632  ORF Transcript_81474/g.134632 Transcript_81474/m.134632 type:complete len:112 (+) Transcript_81474:30-365(+)